MGDTEGGMLDLMHLLVASFDALSKGMQRAVTEVTWAQEDLARLPLPEGWENRDPDEARREIAARTVLPDRLVSLYSEASMALGRLRAMLGFQNYLAGTMPAPFPVSP